MAYEVNGPVDEDPPEVRALALEKQLDAGLDPHLGAALGQVRELAVGQALEQADRAKFGGAYHARAGLLMSSAFGRPCTFPGRGWRDYRDEGNTISGGCCLTTGLRRGAVNVGIHAQVVERSGQDRYRGCTGPAAVAGGSVIIAALPGGEAAHDQPDNKKHRSEVHVASVSLICL
jgi:hypothetical protein